jgi:5-methylcytosine-specific restriction endonuclease McrA
MKDGDNLIYKPIVLKLNANWQVLGFKTVKDAFTDMNSRSDDADAAWGLDIVYPEVDGEPDFSQQAFYNDVPWDEWIQLPVRPYDFAVHTSKLTIRVPTIIISRHFKTMPNKELKASKNNIRIRDNDTCQYTGRKLKPSEGNIDHVIPRDVWKKMGMKGSPDTWTNMVWCDIAVNNKKGNRTNEEAGLRLIRKPRAPLPIPASALVRKANHPSWKPFLIGK